MSQAEGSDRNIPTGATPETSSAEGPKGPLFVIEGERFPDVEFEQLHVDHFISDTSRVVELSDTTRLRPALAAVAGALKPTDPAQAKLFEDPDCRDKQCKAAQKLIDEKVEVGGLMRTRSHIVRSADVVDEMVRELVAENHPIGQYITQLEAELEGREHVSTGALQRFKRNLVAVYKPEEFKDRYTKAVDQKIQIAEALVTAMRWV